MSVNVADNLPDSLTTFFDLSLTRTANLNSRITLQPQAQSELHFIIILLFVYTSITLPDFITVGYSLATYTTTESQGRVDITVVIIQPPARAPRSFSLFTNTEDGTASISRFLSN